MTWTELIELDEKALEDRGVNALGARRKMLKVFEQVKGKFACLETANKNTNCIIEAKAEGRLS
jgi:hypothetical protein